MKKFYALFALLAIFASARAVEWVQDYKIDYSQFSGFPFYVMGYVPEWVDGVMTDMGAMYTYTTAGSAVEADDVIVVTMDGIKYLRIALDEPEWHQYFIADGIPTEIDGSYTVKAMVRASEDCTINVNMGWGWGDGQQRGASVAIPDEWTEVEWEYSDIDGTSCNLVAQPGTTTATIEWKYLIVAHQQKKESITTWQEWLTSDGQPVVVEGNPIATYMGDAETPWPEPEVRFNDQEKNHLVCAWAKEKGRNMNEDGGWEPFPADIEEEEDGNHVFVCHGQPATTVGDASAWDNQFWIQSPRSWKAGEQVKIHFRYKASAPVTTSTQIHNQTPSDYLIWHAIGDIAFTTQWQEFDDVMTFEDDMDGGWSICFNLNTVVKDAVTFYFDDLSWQSIVLDEGYFVAGANPNEGLEYDFENAIQFVYDEAANYYTATIGEKGAYVSQVMISTVRGNNNAFRSYTLKPAGDIANDPNNWLEYTETRNAKLNLPGAGIWKIYLNENDKAMAFEMLEGTDIDYPDINPNPTLITINAVERDYTESEMEGGQGQPWDNQLWIVANRTLKAGETTVIQFKYKSATPARVSTQCHADPGSYLYWAAIGDVNFTEEWQDFEATFTIPSEANDMQSIAFNLSEIKEANRYGIKDVVWKMEDNSESLINQKGSDNFYVKILGTNPEVYVSTNPLWQEWLTSDGQPVIVDGFPIPTYMGDAETPWPDPEVKFNDQEKNHLVCAWAKEKGRNMNEDGEWEPFPADIEEEEDGNHVFVCHGQPATTEGDASAWDNQFWIQSPRSWKAGDQVKIHFRYKASAPVSTDTQIHHQTPSDYLIWHAIGDISFTTEWQEFDGIMNIEDDMDGGWSICFNLNTVVKDAVTFYFDDLSWQSMVLDEGYFVAGANPNGDLEYDFENAIQFVYDETGQYYTATIGEKDAYVSQVMISTVRGNDAAFKNNTLMPVGTIENNPEVWLEYVESSHSKMNLPGEGIWKIYIDDENKYMAFEMIEGNPIDYPEINPNPTLVAVNAVERDYTESEMEGGQGQPWDNQLWIVANRTLSAGERTVLKFKYKSSIPAKVSTQCHAEPGLYIHWSAIGDVNFTEEWQDFETTFIVPSEADGMQSIAFNLSEIKEANRYELKDFVWKLDDNTESLIDQEGSKNFYIKVLGYNPVIFTECTLTAKSGLLNPGKRSNLMLSLDNPLEKVNGFQFEITLPEGVTLTRDGDNFAYSLGSRCNGMNVNIVENQERHYTLIAFFGINGQAIEGTSGPIITLTLQAENEMPDSKLEGVVDNIVLSNLNFDVINVNPVTIPITISGYPLGDVNHDGDVNVVDVMMTVGYILGEKPNKFHIENADVNYDSSINITDVMGIVDIVLHDIPSSVPALVATDCWKTSLTSNGVALHLDNASRYIALEMTVELQQGATLTRANVVNSDVYHVETYDLGGGFHRVMVFSLNGEPLPEDDTLLHLDIANGRDIKISNIVLANSIFEALAPQEATSVKSIAKETADSPLYNIQGMKVTNPRKGVFIKNNQKVIVR